MARARTPLAILVALGLALVRAGHGAADDGPPAAARLAAVKAGVVAALTDLAEWCPGAKLWGRRDAVAAEILSIDPDHAKARGWLKYKRGAGGSWVQDAGFRPAQDVSNAALLPDFRRKRAAIGASFVESALPVADDPALPLREREKTLDLLVRFAPEDERARAAHGEVLAGDRWVLRETVMAKARRPVLDAKSREAVSAVAAADRVKVRTDELALVTSPACVLQSGSMRLVAGLDCEEGRRALRLASASIGVFSAAFGVPSPGPGTFAYCYFGTRQDGLDLVNRHPAFDAAEREFASHLDAWWMPGDAHVLVYAEAAERDTRIEWGPRIALNRQLWLGFGLYLKQGCLYEGFALYLTWRTTGTHQTFTASLGEYTDPRAKDLADRLRSPQADWLDEARTLHKQGVVPDLRLALGKDVNALSATDRLFGFALAAYAIEGRPDEAARFAGAFKDAADVDAALASSLRATPEGLEARMLRWLDETAPPK